MVTISRTTTKGVASLSGLAAVGSLLLFSACQEPPPAPEVGKPAPSFSLPDLEGRAHRLEDYRGKVVVLNYWATWCPPCLDEMPSLERLQTSLGSQGLEVVAISVDERFSDILDFQQKYGFSFTLLHDAGKKVSRAYRTFMYPETYIIDRSGNLKSKVIGPRDWVAPPAIRDLVQLLREPEAEPEATSGAPSGDARVGPETSGS